VLPGHVAEGPEQRLEPADLLGQEGVAARFGDQVVQPAVQGPGLLDEPVGGPRLRGHQPREAGRQGVQRTRVDAAAGRAGGLTLQDAADLADLVDLVRRDAPDDGPAVGQQVDDADAGQGDQGLADRGVAHPEPVGQLLGDQVLAGPQPAPEHVGQDGLDDGLAAQAVVALQRLGLG